MMLPIASRVQPQDLPCRVGRRQRVQHRQNRRRPDSRAEQHHRPLSGPQNEASARRVAARRSMRRRRTGSWEGRLASSLRLYGRRVAGSSSVVTVSAGAGESVSWEDLGRAGTRKRALKYLLKIDLLCFDRQLGVQPVQTKGGAMIKLSDVKVRPQYRTRVRYRLRVL